MRKALDLQSRPLVMGIINSTPDSFYALSSVQGNDALDRAKEFIDRGADIIDIGGESTRPGALYLNAGEEIARVVPIIAEIRKISDIPISIDTRKAQVAQEAISAGANCINDISALNDDPELAQVIAEHGLPVILMHMQGNPKTMQMNPHYENLIEELCEFFEQRIEFAVSQGIEESKIILDPGLGFGKTLLHNIGIVQNLERFVQLGKPLLLGHSRKSFIGKLLANQDFAEEQKLDNIPEPQERLYGSLAVLAAGFMRGVRIFRVHDVWESRQVLDTLYKIEGEL